MADDKSLETLVNAVLDGDVIDWATAESGVGIDRPLVRGLKLVASVARLQRDVLPDTGEHDEEWGHLRLLELVGRGSSGEVFRAWETQLDREVALKLLPASPGGANAIIREGQLLAKVKHPNVVTIYGATQIGDRIGLWMEFIPGHTLEQLLRKTGAFRTADVIAMGLELCRAVSAVHDAGLLHRDIKAQNVMRADDGRVVLMDFGTGHERDDATTVVAGTPLCLAPELLRQEPATVQSDVYSLGVLLYHLASGAYPVRGNSISALRAVHERGDYVSLGAAAPSAGARLARVIEQATDPKPERRFETAAALGAALLALQRYERRKPLLYGAVATIMVALTAVVVWAGLSSGSTPRAQEPLVRRDIMLAAPPVIRSESPPPELATAAVPPRPVRQKGVRPSVQVMPIVNATGRPADAWLSAVLSEMLLREFRGSGAFRWIPGAQALAEAQLGGAYSQEVRTLMPGDRIPAPSNSRMLTILVPDPSGTVRPLVPADIVVSGEFQSSGRPDWVQVVVRVEDKAVDRSPVTVTETGTTADLPDLVSRLGARARAGLGTPALLPGDWGAVRTSQPANAKAARKYVEGLAQGLRDSATSLEESVAADPRFAAAHIRLAEALAELRDWPRVNAAAARAIELASALPREEHLLIQIRALAVMTPQGQARRLIDQKRAIFIELFRLYPDTVFYGIEVARGLTTTDPHGALAIVDAIKALPGGAEDTRVLLIEHASARARRDFGRARRALDGIASLATALGDRSLLASTRHDQAMLAVELDNRSEALSFAEDAVVQFDSSGARSGAQVARATVRGIIRRFGVEWAKVEYGRLITNARDRGDRTAEAALRHGLGVMLMDNGDLSAALHNLGQVQRDWANPERPYGIATALGIAEIAYRRGDLATARRVLESLEWRDGRYEPQDATFALSLFARTLLAQGELAAAREYADWSIKTSQPWEGQVRARRVSAAVLLALGEFGLASGQLSQARETLRSQNDEETQYDLAIGFAIDALENRRGQDARGFAHRALLLAQDNHWPDASAAAGGLLAEAWLAEGNLAEAQRAIAPVEARIKETEHRLLRLSAGISSARVAHAGGTTQGDTRARQQLGSVSREAAAIGAVAIEFEAQLALGEIEMAAGDVTRGRPRLMTLGRDAGAKGFVNLAKKAAAAAR